MHRNQGLRASLSRRPYPWLNTDAPSGACLPRSIIAGIVPLLIYPGRIPKFNRDLKRAVPKTHLRNQSPNNS